MKRLLAPFKYDGWLLAFCWLVLQIYLICLFSNFGLTEAADVIKEAFSITLLVYLGAYLYMLDITDEGR